MRKILGIARKGKKIAEHEAPLGRAVSRIGFGQAGDIAMAEGQL
jgi:hypothetical protein